MREAVDSTRNARPARLGSLIALIVTGGFMAGLDTSLVNVGLSTIADDLGGSLAGTQWVTSGYLLALAAALPACAWLQRRIGPSRLWMIALVVFTIASVLCAIAPSLPMLIAARVLKGIAGGLLVPTGQNIIVRAVDPDHLGRVMSTAGIPIMLAPAVGPALGGILVDTLSWRWLFLMNLPIGLVAVLLARQILPRDTPDPTARFDAVGFLLLATGLPALSLGLSLFSTSVPLAALLSGTGLALLAAYVIEASRARRPGDRPSLLHLALFRHPPYAIAQVTVFFTGLSLFGGLILLPLYFERLRGMSVVGTGFLLLAYGAGATMALIVGGRLTDRRGAGITTVIGLIVTIAGTLPFVFLPADTHLVVVELLQAVRGIGVGMAGTPAMAAVLKSGRSHLGDSTTTANIIQRVGGGIGSAIVVITVSRAGLQPAGFQAAFGILTGTAVIALIAAAALVVSERRQLRATVDHRRAAD
ncbi:MULTISPECIES: DHA2 family efflux MFS transporter permease subunit [Pseudonocardia]|uniref:MFS transporter n=2 Tax=Pseudonocardia TaxID=1847 RepID=A0ABQ0RUR6_9PSEU|nr:MULTISPECIES: DHA2 family efflux MFS transporter permease subunit [Pseudonocardia]OSY42772.1 putative transport protein HsrA [Pseudonocardia autotrophica]TDN77349.1 EmrB/QacA subfamily drug resistance transporter [Pseudonocardia autotrophica]BBG01371.1 MFS transporter [Pseudonocardia autotrophica]GEC24427.1 MFS transporter [Pseudonocardia saturnea]